MITVALYAREVAAKEPDPEPSLYFGQCSRDQ